MGDKKRRPAPAGGGAELVAKSGLGGRVVCISGRVVALVAASGEGKECGDDQQGLEQLHGDVSSRGRTQIAKSPALCRALMARHASGGVWQSAIALSTDQFPSSRHDGGDAAENVSELHMKAQL